MAKHRWTITHRNTGSITRSGVCDSGYGDESLYEVFAALHTLGFGEADVSTVSDDLHARYGRKVGDGVELNIRPSENSQVEAVCGDYRINVDVEPES